MHVGKRPRSPSSSDTDPAAQRPRTDLPEEPRPADIPETPGQLKEAERILASELPPERKLEDLLKHRCWTAFWNFRAQNPNTWAHIGDEAAAKAMLELSTRKPPDTATLPVEMRCILGDTWSPAATRFLTLAIASRPAFFRKIGIALVVSRYDFSETALDITAALRGVPDLDLTINNLTPPGHPAANAYGKLISNLPCCLSLGLVAADVVRAGSTETLLASSHLAKVEKLELGFQPGVIVAGSQVADLTARLLPLCSAMTTFNFVSQAVQPHALAIIPDTVWSQPNLRNLNVGGIDPAELLSRVKKFGPQVSSVRIYANAGIQVSVEILTRACVPLLSQLQELELRYPVDLSELSAALENIQGGLETLKCIAVLRTNDQFEIAYSEAFRAFSQNRRLVSVEFWDFPPGTNLPGWVGMSADGKAQFVAAAQRNRVQFESGGFGVGARLGFASEVKVTRDDGPGPASEVNLPDDVWQGIFGYLDEKSQVQVSAVSKTINRKAKQIGAESHSSGLKSRTRKDDVAGGALDYVLDTRLPWEDETTIRGVFSDESSVEKALTSVGRSKAIQWLNALPALKQSGLDSKTIQHVIDRLRALPAGLTSRGVATIMHELGYPLEISVAILANHYDPQLWQIVAQRSIDADAVKAFIFVANTRHEWPVEDSPIKKLSADQKGRKFLEWFVPTLTKTLTAATSFFMALPALRRSGLHEDSINFIYLQVAGAFMISATDHARLLERLEPTVPQQLSRLAKVRDKIGLDRTVDVLRLLGVSSNKGAVFIAASSSFFAPPQPRPNWQHERTRDAHHFWMVLSGRPCPAGAQLSRFIRGDVGQRYWLPEIKENKAGRDRFLAALKPLREAGLPVEDIAHVLGELKMAGKIPKDEMREVLKPLKSEEREEVLLGLAYIPVVAQGAPAGQ